MASTVSAPQAFNTYGGWFGSDYSSLGMMDMTGLGMDTAYLDPSFMANLNQRSLLTNESIRNENDIREGIIQQAVENYCQFLEGGYEKGAFEAYKEIEDLISRSSTYNVRDENGAIDREKLRDAVFRRLNTYAEETRHKNIQQMISETDSGFIKNLKFSREGFDDTINREDLIEQLTGKKDTDNLHHAGRLLSRAARNTGLAAAGLFGISALEIPLLSKGAGALLSLLGKGALCAPTLLAGIAGIAALGYVADSIIDSMWGKRPLSGMVSSFCDWVTGLFSDKTSNPSPAAPQRPASSETPVNPSAPQTVHTDTRDWRPSYMRGQPAAAQPQTGNSSNSKSAELKELFWEAVRIARQNQNK